MFSNPGGFTIVDPATVSASPSELESGNNSIQLPPWTQMFGPPPQAFSMEVSGCHTMKLSVLPSLLCLCRYGCCLVLIRSNNRAEEIVTIESIPLPGLPQPSLLLHSSSKPISLIFAAERPYFHPHLQHQENHRQDWQRLHRSPVLDGTAFDSLPFSAQLLQTTVRY